MKKKNEEGFTFIETIIVIAITLIFSAGIGFSAAKYIDQAKVASCKNQISTFKLSLQSYYIDCGIYPTQAQGLIALWEKPLFSPVPELWNGPYLDREIPKDPWGNSYIYKSPGEKGLPFIIYSYGADGKETGDGFNADIISWK